MAQIRLVVAFLFCQISGLVLAGPHAGCGILNVGHKKPPWETVTEVETATETVTSTATLETTVLSISTQHVFVEACPTHVGTVVTATAEVTPFTVFTRTPGQKRTVQGWSQPYPSVVTGQVPWPTRSFNCYNYHDIFMHDLFSVRGLPRCSTYFPVQSWATQTCYTWPGTPMQFVNKPRCKPGENPNPATGADAADNADSSREVIAGWMQGNVFVEANATPVPRSEQEDRCRRGWLEDC